MGGLWEVGVKSFKTLFYKSPATRMNTFKELSTFIAKIEACLHSRALSPMSEDSASVDTRSLLFIVEPKVKEESKSIINR